jgi:predicted dehydrogenase
MASASDDQDKVRIGFIGAGNWAEYNHMPILKSRQDVELIGIATPTQKSRNRVQARFDIPYATPDYLELLAQPLDAVVISSPHGYHYEQAKTSLEAGLHVLVEKPMTLYASQAWELVDLVEKLNRVLVVPTGYHYLPMVQAAKKQMQKSAVGTVEYMLCHMGSSLRSLYTGTPWPYGMEDIPDPKDYYSDPKVSGGGQGYSQLSHSVMLLLWLTGLRAIEVFAYMTGPNAKVEMYDAIVAKFDNGSIATISGAGTQPPNDTKHELDIRIFGSAGELRLDLYREWMEVRRNDNNNFSLDVRPGDGDYACDGPVHQFIDLIQGKESENFSPGDVAAKTIELIEAAYRSFASGQPEKI